MMKIKELYATFLNHPEITTDSRNCPQGSLFFALKGENFDGNKFVMKALNQGCAYAIADDPSIAVDHRIIKVENVLQTLQNLANYHRKQFDIPVIGITGTNGKTTTKELLAAVLMQKYNTLFTQGNLNNHIGVPLTLLQLKKEHDIAIIEMGANHPKEIAFLCNIAAPNYGLITNIGKAHLEGFGSFENIIKTKKELYDFIIQNEGTLFVNQQNKLLCSLRGKAHTVLYGGDTNKPILNILQSNPYLTITLTKEETIIHTALKITGSYNLENLAAATSIGNFFNIPLQDIAHALSQYTPQNNRSQVKVTAHNTLVLDMYNANPTSMQAAIQEFGSSINKNKVVILGDMMELGRYSKQEHQQIIELLQVNNYERIICIGPQFFEFKQKYPNIEFFKTTNDALLQFKTVPIRDANVLLKGSRGMKLEVILNEL